jgi:nitric oxide synthase oxygenase domain/subunit
MKLYITICGARQKVSLKGAEYGWRSTVFCTVEKFWGETVFEKAKRISAKEATDRITEQIYKLNPAASAGKIRKFIERYMPYRTTKRLSSTNTF